ncbi:MAG: hypothetical protein GY932_06830 [Arcobacter sp.]|nr:hypothetical protein [Arcobacter sp.]
MNLKLLAVITIVLSIIIFILGFIFQIPLVFIPYDYKITQIVFLNILFILFEVFFIMFLFKNMLEVSKLDLHDFILFFKRF